MCKLCASAARPFRSSAAAAKRRLSDRRAGGKFCQRGVCGRADRAEGGAPTPFGPEEKRVGGSCTLAAISQEAWEPRPRGDRASMWGVREPRPRGDRASMWGVWEPRPRGDRASMWGVWEPRPRGDRASMWGVREPCPRGVRASMWGVWEPRPRGDRASIDRASLARPL